MRILILVFMFCGAAQAQRSDFLKPLPKQPDTWKPYKGPVSIASLAVCVGGTAADIGSSQGLLENNKLFRNSQGHLDNRKALIGFVPCGISYLFERKHPKAAAIFRFVYGSIHIGAAIHNWRQ